jgi:hypothetical protein
MSQITVLNSAAHESEPECKPWFVTLVAILVSTPGCLQYNNYCAEDAAEKMMLTM